MVTDQLIKQALLLAEQIQSQSLIIKNNSSFKTRLKVLFTHPESKTFLIQMMDVSFRPRKLDRVAAFVKKIFDRSGTAAFALFSGMEQILVRVFLFIGHRFPGISIPVMLSGIQKDSEKVVFLKDSSTFRKHIQNRRKSGIRSNVNLIGESLLGEEEASYRIDQYKKLLQDPEADYISIKISTIFSQINVLAFDETVQILSDRLAILYDELIQIKQQTGKVKFINLDMEEYRDMSVTVAVFTKTLSLARFKTLRAGIVLQAYIPDSYQWLLKLQAWAKERVQTGGALIKIRVVKGANLEMEKTESALHGWPLVTYDSKRQADANYKRMLLTLLSQTSVKSIQVGVASHNVFDMAFAMVLVKEHGLQEQVEFEMLEGMANNVVHILKQEGMQVLLYTPVVKPEQYISAIAYLVRRLDEGTADGNFLKEGFDLLPIGPKWELLKKEFLASVALIDQLSDQPNRTQNRLAEPAEEMITGFSNEPDTDWILPANREWLKNIRTKWENNPNVLPATIPVVGAGPAERETFRLNCWQGELPWTYELATQTDYAEALEKAKTSSWFKLSHAGRIAIIRKAASELKKRRGDLIGVAVAEVGKLVTETDPEVSEAIDFANYYACSMEELLQQEEVVLTGGKVHLVLPPWNFPIAIPAGGILSSLVTGNVVLLKPSQNAIACSYVLCECLWKAGVPTDALFFLPAKEEVLQPFLTQANVFGGVILTGGTDTARLLLRQNSTLPLYAETGGKNATIVTALSDREQAISHVLQSAFGNAGQKCSATSLLILEKEVYEDEQFKSALADAVRSLKTGSPWEFSSRLGPLAVPIQAKVKQVLSDSSDWLIPPKTQDWYLHPCIKWNVKKEDFAYQNELFAPILSVMCADNLAEAIELANGTGFGLTSGLESLDEDEISYWMQHIQAGNLYVNRPTTGAIVQRQPFGGIRQSSFGFGMKAGGANYLTQFVQIQKSESCLSRLHVANSLPNSTENYAEVNLNSKESAELHYAKADYARSFETHFSRPYEEVKIRGQYNTKRYLQPGKVALCIDASTDLKSVLLVKEACYIMKCELEVYLLESTGIPSQFLALSQNVRMTSWEEIMTQVNETTRWRILTNVIPTSFRLHAADKAVHLYDGPVLPFGRFEFLNYLTEQSVSHNYHRYGNLMGKEA